MASIKVNGVIPGPVAAVWAVAGDFGGIANWVPALKDSNLTPESNGTSVGDMRQCNIDGGPSLVETQTARSDADWTYTYAIPEGPLPMKNYESTIRLEAAGDQTTLEWTATFDPDPGAEEELTAMVTGVYQAGIDTLKQRFGE